MRIWRTYGSHILNFIFALAPNDKNRPRWDIYWAIYLQVFWPPISSSHVKFAGRDDFLEHFALFRIRIMVDPPERKQVRVDWTMLIFTSGKMWSHLENCVVWAKKQLYFSSCRVGRKYTRLNSRCRSKNALHPPKLALLSDPFPESILKRSLVYNSGRGF